MYCMYSPKLLPTIHTFEIPVENKRRYVFIHTYQYITDTCINVKCILQLFGFLSYN